VHVGINPHQHAKAHNVLVERSAQRHGRVGYECAAGEGCVSRNLDEEIFRPEQAVVCKRIFDATADRPADHRISLAIERRRDIAGDKLRAGDIHQRAAASHVYQRPVIEAGKAKPRAQGCLPRLVCAPNGRLIYEARKRLALPTLIQQGVKIAFDANNPLAPLTIAAGLAANDSPLDVCRGVDASGVWSGRPEENGRGSAIKAGGLPPSVTGVASGINTLSMRKRPAPEAVP